MPRHLTIRFKQLVLMGAVCLLVPPMLERASAQDQSSAQRVEGPHQAAPATLQEIIITATKRAQNIQDVPESVTALSEHFINLIQANNLSDISAYVPGLNVQPSGVDANKLVIRGLSTGPDDLSPSVGVYLDGAPFGSDSGYALGALFSPDVDPYDLKDIEVLRGPQGTLYGANTLAGLVNYTTKPPNLHKAGGYVMLDLGDEDETGALTEIPRAGVNIPLINGKVALRLSGYYQNTDGDLSNVRTGQTGLNAFIKSGGLADLLIQPTGKLKIDLIALLDSSRVPYAGEVTGNAVTLQPTYGQYAGFDYLHGFAKSQYSMFVANVHYQLDDGITATSTTSLSREAISELGDDTTIFQPAFGSLLGPLFEFPGVVRPSTKRLTEEFRIASPAHAKFEWLGGLYFDHEDSNYLSAIDSTYLYGATPPAALAPAVDLLSDYETVNTIERYVETAAYGDVTYHLLPSFSVSGGVRYSIIHQHLASEGSGYLADLGLIPTFATSTSMHHVLLGSFSARWHFDPNAMVYARIAQGFRPGGPNLTGKAFNPDTTVNYEVGVKGAGLQGRLRTDADVFYINWKDIQLNFFNGTVTVIGNAGNAISEGVELEEDYTPVAGLTIGANADYTKAYISSLLPGAEGGAASGDSLPFDSKWSGALRADYDFPVGAAVEGNVGTSLRYKSSFNTTFPGDTGTRFYDLPAELFADFRMGASYENYDLEFQVLNVANRRVLNGAQETLGVSAAAADAFGQPVFLSYAPGRMFGLELSARF